jgi:hypothetical protein
MVSHFPLNFDSSRITLPARELARRLSGTDEIVLLWHPEDDRVEVSVCDVMTGAAVHIDIAPGDAMDAFTHTYAYVASREAVDHGASDEVVAPVDG